MTSMQQLQIAVAHHQANRLREAETIYRQILAQDPNNANALNLLGTLAGQIGRHDAAIQLISKAIALQPKIPQFHGNLGAIYLNLQRHDQAIASLKSAVALDPKMTEAHQNLGNAYLAVAQYDQAATEFRKAITLAPHWAEPHNSLALSFRHQGKYDEAVAEFHKALANDPNHANAHWNLSLTELRLGNFESGWRRMEWRIKCPSVPMHRNLLKPQWTGSDIRSQTILLHAEQGYGDTLQFIRYAPLVADRGANVIVESPPDLVNILAGVKGISQIIPLGQPLPAFDIQIPLMSLPLVFQTTLQTIPAQIPYLSAPPDRIANWSHRLGPPTQKRIGLVWAGRAEHPEDHRRSIRLADFAPLAEFNSAQFFSLQKGPAAAQAASPPPGLNLEDFSAELNNFVDTGALIANLDLIITVDTAVAHLAAAMNKPVWMLLPFIPDWRWLLNRTDTPWYPTMKLFRQPRDRDWPAVIANIAATLRSI
jgi:Flp pilus assembly protein TadD